MRVFLWSDDSLALRNHVAKPIVCLPILEGGMGIRRIVELNEGCLLKLGRQSMTSTSLWAQRFCNKYFKKGPPKNTKVGSCIWKKLRPLGCSSSAGYFMESW